MKTLRKFPFLFFLYFFTINQLFAQYNGGDYDGFDVFTTSESSTLNGIYMSYAKFAGGSYDGYTFLTGVLTQLDGQQTSVVKYEGGVYDGFYFLVSNPTYLDGKSVMYRAYFGGSFDGFDVYTALESSTLDGIYMSYAKFAGGSYDGYTFLTGVITQLDGQQTSVIKYTGGTYDGYNFLASILYLDGKSLMYQAYFGGAYDGYVSTISQYDISLPVTLTLFALEEIPFQTMVKIEWRTESEMENAYWLLLRKTESDSFMTLQKLPGQGNSSVVSNYAYQDSEVEAGSNYTYQLADVSMKGHITYHEEKSISVSVPKSFELFQNYPNPFNPNTNIKFALPVSAKVRLKIYNILGQKVIDLLDQHKKVGYHTIEWNGKNGYGNNVSSGMYIYLMQVEGTENSQNEPFQRVKKMLLVR